MIGFNSHTFKRVVKELHKVKVFVVVPRIAVTTEAEIELYGEPVDFINGQAVKASLNNPETVFLPLSKVIDIYHEDYSISITRKEDLLKITKSIESILDRLENQASEEAKEVYDYVNDFYESIVKQNKDKIIRRMEKDKPKVLGLSDTLTGNYAERSNKLAMIDLSDIVF